MITKHCVRYSLSLCPKQAKGVTGVRGTVRAEPMVLRHGEDTVTLRFDCKPCEMHVVGRIRKNVLQQAKAEPMTFYRARPARGGYEARRSTASSSRRLEPVSAGIHRHRHVGMLAQPARGGGIVLLARMEIRPQVGAPGRPQARHQAVAAEPGSASRWPRCRAATACRRAAGCGSSAAARRW